jgi:hypothetical protein
MLMPLSDVIVARQRSRDTSVTRNVSVHVIFGYPGLAPKRFTITATQFARWIDMETFTTDNRQIHGKFQYLEKLFQLNFAAAIQQLHHRPDRSSLHDYRPLTTTTPAAQTNGVTFCSDYQQWRDSRFESRDYAMGVAPTVIIARQRQVLTNDECTNVASWRRL